MATPRSAQALFDLLTFAGHGIVRPRRKILALPHLFGFAAKLCLSFHCHT